MVEAFLERMSEMQDDENWDYCRRFFKLYASSSIAPQVGGQLEGGGVKAEGGMALSSFGHKYPKVSALLFSVPRGHHKHG